MTYRKMVEILRKQIEAQAKKASPIRAGIEYSWYNAAALDAGIAAKRRWAQTWRERAIDALEGADEVVKRTVKAISKYRGSNGRAERTYTVFSADGRDVYAVVASLTPHNNGNVEVTAEDMPGGFEEWLDQSNTWNRK